MPTLLESVATVTGPDLFGSTVAPSTLPVAVGVVGRDVAVAWVNGTRSADGHPVLAVLDRTLAATAVVELAGLYVGVAQGATIIQAGKDPSQFLAMTSAGAGDLTDLQVLGFTVAPDGTITEHGLASVWTLADGAPADPVILGNRTPPYSSESPPRDGLGQLLDLDGHQAAYDDEGRWFVALRAQALCWFDQGGTPTSSGVDHRLIGVYHPDGTTDPLRATVTDVSTSSATPALLLPDGSTVAARVGIHPPFTAMWELGPGHFGFAAGLPADSGSPLAGATWAPGDNVDWIGAGDAALAFDGSSIAGFVGSAAVTQGEHLTVAGHAAPRRTSQAIGVIQAPTGAAYAASIHDNGVVSPRTPLRYLTSWRDNLPGPVAVTRVGVGDLTRPLVSPVAKWQWGPDDAGYVSSEPPISSSVIRWGSDFLRLAERQGATVLPVRLLRPVVTARPILRQRQRDDGLQHGSVRVARRARNAATSRQASQRHGSRNTFT